MTDKITADALKQKNIPNLNGSARVLSAYDFTTYTSLNALTQILTGDHFGFYVSPLANMNDLDEAERHKTLKEKVFALCFCNTENEGIPMWYMYSGVSGKGASLSFTPGKMKDFLKSIEKVYPIENGAPNFDKELIVGKDFSVTSGWIFYEKGESIFHKRTWYDNIEDYNSFLKDNFFVKKYPWKYENEFRIVIKTNSNENYQKLFIPIPIDIKKHLKIKYGPGFYNNRTQKYEYDKSAFEKVDIKKITNSDLKINMNIISRHFEDICDNLDPVLVDEKCKDIYCSTVKRICNKKGCKK